MAPTERAAAKLASANKLYVRERIDLLFDDCTFVEDGQLANAMAVDLPADGVVTGRGLVDGRPALVVANDPSVKAGSWGARTVEKIIRMTRWRCVTSCRSSGSSTRLARGSPTRSTCFLAVGARVGSSTTRSRCPARCPRSAAFSARARPAGPTYPSFCDIVIMVEANASMYLGSPRMAEMVVGEKVTLEEMGGARMHATISGCGDQLAADDTEAIEQASSTSAICRRTGEVPCPPTTRWSRRGASPMILCRQQESAGYDIRTVIEAIVDDGSFFEVKPLFAPELVTGLAFLDGEVIGIVANQPAVKGGVLFVDSADKGARFIWQCDAFSIPLLYFGGRARIHDRQCCGAAGHHSARREDDHRSR